MKVKDFLRIRELNNFLNNFLNKLIHSCLSKLHFNVVQMMVDYYYLLVIKHMVISILNTYCITLTNHSKRNY